MRNTERRWPGLVCVSLSWSHLIESYSFERAIAEAKARGVQITCEASPHHLTLTHEVLHERLVTRLKMNPPLRTEEDRLELIAGLRDGTLDCVATDHAPHTNYEKDKEFDYAPNGILGLNAALPVTLGVLYREAKFKLPKVIDLFTRAPAAILGLPAGTLAPGAAADLCLFDLNERWTYNAIAGFSKSANSPWHNQELRGRIKSTYVNGRLVFDGQRIR